MHSSILDWRIPMDRVAWQSPWDHKKSDTTERLGTAECVEKKLVETQLLKIVNERGKLDGNEIIYRWINKRLLKIFQ